jgi:hypothetical protein
LLLISDLLGLNRGMNIEILKNLGINGGFSVCYRNERHHLLLERIMKDIICYYMQIKENIIILTDANINNYISIMPAKN